MNKKWGENQLKREAAKLGLYLTKRRSRYYSRDKKITEEQQKQLYIALQK